MKDPISEIVVIGSLNMDLVVKTLRIPGPGETLHGNEFHMIPGGKGANQAVAAARLGARVSIIGRVGQDSFGEILCKNLVADRVDTANLQHDPVAPTGVALIMVEGSGENRIIVVSGANREVSPQDVLAAEQLLKSAKILVVQFEVPMPVVKAVLHLANRFQIPVIVNAAPAYPIEKELIPLIDYLVVNEHEAEVLSGIAVTNLESAARAGRILVQYGAKNVVLTLGALGAQVCNPTQEYYVPGFTIQAVDTTGAGDAFIGGLAVSLLDGNGLLPEKVRFANAAGAVAATRIGAQSSLPNLAEVEDMLASTNSPTGISLSDSRHLAA